MSATGTGPLTGPPPGPAGDWFDAEVSQLGRFLSTLGASAQGSYLSETRHEYQQAAALFYGKAQHVISVFFAIFGVVGLTVSFVLKDAPGYGGILVAPGLLMLAGVVYGEIAVRLLQSSYRLYVSSVVYSAQVHAAVGADTHAWFRFVGEWRKRLADRFSGTASSPRLTKPLWARAVDVMDDLRAPDWSNDVHGLVREWMESDRGNLLIQYRRGIRILQLLCVFGGLTCLGAGLLWDPGPGTPGGDPTHSGLRVGATPATPPS